MIKYVQLKYHHAQELQSVTVKHANSKKSWASIRAPLSVQKRLMVSPPRPDSQASSEGIWILVSWYHHDIGKVDLKIWIQNICPKTPVEETKACRFQFRLPANDRSDQRGRDLNQADCAGHYADTTLAYTSTTVIKMQPRNTQHLVDIVRLGS